MTSTGGGGLRRGVGAVLMGAAVAGCAGGVNTPVGFHRALVMSDDPAGLTVVADSCHSQPYEVRASESASEVRIELVASVSEGQVAAACSDLVEIRLKKPLGTRRLIDASSGRQVPIGSTPAGTDP